MIWTRRATARSHERRGKREVWRSFDPRDRSGSFSAGFGTLEALDENRLAPGGELADTARETGEVVTYVREGVIAYRDSAGHSGVIYAGEFERMTTSRGVHHRETNASRADSAHVFRVRLHDAGRVATREQKRFSVAERRGILCVVASPDLQTGSLHLHQDTWLYSAILERGQHVVHALAGERAAWLHVVHGEITLGDLVLTSGDGVGLAAERAVSLTARQPTEILLFDVVVRGLQQGSS